MSQQKGTTNHKTNHRTTGKTKHNYNKTTPQQGQDTDTSKKQTGQHNRKHLTNKEDEKQRNAIENHNKLKAATRIGRKEKKEEKKMRRQLTPDEKDDTKRPQITGQSAEPRDEQIINQ